MRIFKSFAKVTAKRKESCKNIQKKARFLATLLSLVFYLLFSISSPILPSYDFHLSRFRLLSFHLTIFILVVFCTSFYTFRKCSSSFSLGMSAVSW